MNVPLVPVALGWASVEQVDLVVGGFDLNEVLPDAPPLPVQPVTVPFDVSVLLTPPDAGNGGVNLNVPLACRQVIMGAAAAGPAAMTPIGSIIATAKNKTSDFLIRGPLMAGVEFLCLLPPGSPVCPAARE